MAWNREKQERALADGWGIFDNSNHGIRIERHGSRFDCDAAAQAYVAVRAINGDKLCREAWHEVADMQAVPLIKDRV